PRQPGRAPGATLASPADRPSPGAPRSSLRAMVDLVGEAPFPPVVDVPGLGALRLDELEEPVDRGPDRLLFQVRVEDDHDLVRPQRLVPPVDRDPCSGPDGLPAAPGVPDGKEQAELEQ